MISIQQPWTDALLVGFGGRRKPVENRTWWTDWRGPLLLHAGQRYDDEGARWILQRFGLLPPARGALERKGRMSAILGGVLLTDCVNDHPSEWFCGPFGHVYAGPVLMERPIPYRGHLSLLDFDAGRLGPGTAVDRMQWTEAVRELNEQLWAAWDVHTSGGPL